MSEPLQRAGLASGPCPSASRFDIKAFPEAVFKNGLLPLDLLGHEVNAWIEEAAGRN